MIGIDIPGYQIRREVGAGGMANVYLAVQTSLDREVALKVMAPMLAADPTFSLRFLQEARMLASLAHPNIVQVYDVGVTPEQLNYFSMQYLPGGDFASRVRHGIGERELARVLEGVAAALGYAHKRGYVHRDVAPGNILFDANETPVLTDFGIARAISQGARITSAGISVGTSHYMSPEQARGGEVDARSDLYGLGVLTWYGLTGKPPYDGADGFAVSYAHVFEPIPRLPPDKAAWQPLIDRALAKDPAERFQDAEEFIAALSPFAASRTGASTAATPTPEPATRVLRREPPPAPPPSRPADDDTPSAVVTRLRAWLPLGAAVLGGLLLIGVGIIALRPRPAAENNKPQVTKQVAPAPAPIVKVAVPEPTPAPPPAVVDEARDENAPPPAEEAEAETLSLDSLPLVLDPVVELVRLARNDLAGQRLMNPPGANAFERYSLALKIDPKNKAARQGVVDTAKAYLDLAEKSWTSGNAAEFTAYLAKAGEVAATVPEGQEIVAAAKARRTKEVDKLLAEAETAAERWDKTAARAAWERALALDAGNAKARDGLSKVDRIGAVGYVFRDRAESRNGPELVVVAPRLAMARREVSRGEFARWWQAAGQRAFASRLPSCRDRESLFRSSRKRGWQDPGFTQDDSHPVVCVSFAMAQAYADWVGKEVGQRYRLPTPAEWDQIARQAPAASCTSANLADAAYRAAYDARQGADCDDGFAATSPVGRFPPVAGVYDIDGNVREWVGACGKGAPLTAGCREHVVRGRGWMSAVDKETVSQSDSFGEDVAMNTVGFRLVRELDR